jgi:hypothetical protein
MADDARKRASWSTGVSERFNVTHSRRGAAGTDTPGLDADTPGLDGDRRDVDSDRRDLGSDRRDADSDRRDLDSDSRGVDSDRRDLGGDRSDLDGDKRDLDGDRRDLDSDRRDLDCDRRDFDCDRPSLDRVVRAADLDDATSDARYRLLQAGRVEVGVHNHGRPPLSPRTLADTLPPVDPRLPNYTHLADAPPTPDPAPDHVAEVAPRRAEPEAAELHLGAGPELTACGLPRESLNVTDARAVFREAKAGRLRTQRLVCATCESRSVGGPMR